MYFLPPTAKLSKREIARTSDGKWIKAGSDLAIHELTLAQLKQYDVGRLKPNTRYARRFPEQQPVDGQRIPTLQSVISLLKKQCDPAAKLWIEIKTSPERPAMTPSPEVVADAVVNIVRKEKISTQVFILCSENSTRHSHGLPVSGRQKFKQYQTGTTRGFCMDRGHRYR
jgi:hypothetical protein